MIGIDDFETTPPNCPPPNSTNHQNTTEKSPPRFGLSDVEENAVGEISNSSSSSGSDSDSDSDPDNTVINKVSKTNGHHSNGTSSSTRNSTHLLNEDLCLSESGSDSD